MALNGASALQSSVAFLQIQKNANFKRTTSMNEDVFRIFRQTGRRIALIKQQVERERCTYLKDSYSEKNQLYKELAGIFNSKKALVDKSKQRRGDPRSAVSLPVLYSQASLRAAEGTTDDRDRHFSARKSMKELRSINVNVLKRCECCRRRAFRTVDNEDDIEDGFDEEAFQGETGGGETPDDKTQDKAKTRKKSQKSKVKGNKEKTALVQFSRYDDVNVRIPATQRVRAGIWALRKQTNGRAQSKKKKSVSFQVNGSTTSQLNHPEEKPASTTPATLTTITRPRTLKSRASIKLETQASKTNERLHLEGNAWTSHLENVQGKKWNGSGTISGLSKACCAFRNLVSRIEDDHDSEQVAQDEEFKDEGHAEVIDTRPASHLSRTDSRWLPLRRSSDTLSIRLNSWTAGSLEPARVDSFNENGEQEE